MFASGSGHQINGFGCRLPYAFHGSGRGGITLVRPNREGMDTAATEVRQLSHSKDHTRGQCCSSAPDRDSMPDIGAGCSSVPEAI